MSSAPAEVVVVDAAKDQAPAKAPEFDAKLKVGSATAELKVDKKTTADDASHVVVIEDKSASSTTPAVVVVPKDKDATIKASVHAGPVEASVSMSTTNPATVVVQPTPLTPSPTVVVVRQPRSHVEAIEDRTHLFGAIKSEISTLVSRSLHTSPSLVVQAGSVVFAPSNPPFKQVLVMLKPESSEWMLPKGRQLAGDDLPHTAIRKVLEETGVPIKLVQHLQIRRKQHLHSVEEDVILDRLEPFAVEKRHFDNDTLHLIFWYVGVIDEERAAHVDRAKYNAQFMPYREILADHSLTYEDDREVIQAALEALGGHDGKHCCVM